jgi:hypothetical protein
MCLPVALLVLSLSQVSAVPGRLMFFSASFSFIHSPDHFRLNVPLPWVFLWEVV